MTATSRDQLVRPDRRGRQPLPRRRFLQRDATPRAGARLPAGAQRPAAQGVRPAVLRAAAPRRTGQGRPRRAPVRRVRRRPARTAALHALRRGAARLPASTPRYGAYIDEVSALSLALANVMSLLRTPPPAAWGGHGSPGGVRGDQLGAVAQDRRRDRAGGPARRRRGLLPRARRGRRRPRAGRDPRHLRTPGGRRSLPVRRRPVRGGQLPAPRSALRRPSCWPGGTPRWRPHREPTRSAPVSARAAPCSLRGADSVADEDGVEHPVTRPVVAVCTCGKSGRKPWCDSTHKAIPRSPQSTS